MRQIDDAYRPLSGSEAFVEVNMLYAGSILRHDGVSQLGLQLRHRHGTVIDGQSEVRQKGVWTEGKKKKRNMVRMYFV